MTLSPKRFSLRAGSVLAALLGAAGVALAHVSVTDSSIAPDAVLGTPPETFAIEFSQPVGLVSFGIETGGGEAVSLDFSPPAGMHAKIAVPLPRLAPGDYVAKWRLMAKDGHAMAGEIRFSVAAPEAP